MAEGRLSTFDKVTIVTGGTRGIGLACARVFVRAGASVVICARGKQEGETAAAELNSTGPGACHFVACDMTRPDDVRRVVDETVRLHGRIDCLINNAGWHPDHRPIDGFSAEEFEALLRLNLVSYFVASKYALPHLRKTRGSIINVGSLVGNIGQEWATIYCATKGGITAFTKALAVDEARHGVRVNAVLPGNVRSDMFDKFVDAKPNAQQVRDYIDSWQWIGRVADPEEIGTACLFLASDGASFITGVEFPVTGGAELAYGIKWTKQGRIEL
jgi:NAD(P)-dependent dehydrogenase (short-subunit alcohol dehydrogenase family)